MSEFAEWLDNVGATKEDVRDEILKYFNYPKMSKWIDTETGHSVYKCKTQCWLNRECGFVVVFVPRDRNPAGTIERLANLEWDALQTIVLPAEGNERVPSVEYVPLREGLLTSTIERTKETPEASTYTCKELPIVVTLTGEGKNGASWNDSGRIINALESYQTTITWIL